MATKTTVILEDDLDGSEADESITFGIDGVEYEIDLNADHADELREALATWVDHARRVGGRTKAAGRPALKRTVLPDAGAPIGAAERHAIQRFALANGLKPPAERGRIATTVMDEWKNAGSPMG